ncbi:Methyltransferase type 11 [Corchorus olitorius]|uniref:Methyltransferase type 11 n=1 Tax=Corchorus olitorius TaxID=93759 RepID=A0A1R3HT32_9ROSI|nr:Methyltransferase type 11 [Corchorus olitorius]
MDFKTFKLMIFHGSLARRVLLRAFMIAAALSIVPLLQMISGVDPVMLHTLSSSADCAIESDNSGPFMFPGTFLFSKIWGSFGSVHCNEDGNLTSSVIRELMGKQMLSYGVKALCVGEGSMSAVMALRELGFSDVTGVYRHPFFSLKHKKFVYELDYADNSYDFVLSRDLDKVSVPALLVLEIERVLKPGGIGAMLVGISGSDPTSLIRSATPVSSLLKASSVVHVDYVNEFTLVVFKKKLENTTYFEQYRLPADCPSLTSNKAILDHMEPLVEEKPIGFEKSIAYLPKFVNLSSKQHLVYIDIGAGEHLNNDNGTSWFLPSYPVDHKAFDVYFVDHNTSVMLSYVKKPGINFVYYPGLATANLESKASADSGTDDDFDPYVEDDGFDFLLWFKDTVQYANFVVLKMNAGAAELKLLSDLFESGLICFIDEVFLHCSDHMEGGGVVKGDCMDLFKALRRSGVYVHQWWGN